MRIERRGRNPRSGPEQMSTVLSSVTIVRFFPGTLREDSSPTLLGHRVGAAKPHIHPRASVSPRTATVRDLSDSKARSDIDTDRSGLSGPSRRGRCDPRAAGHGRCAGVTPPIVKLKTSSMRPGMANRRLGRVTASGYYNVVDSKGRGNRGPVEVFPRWLRAQAPGG